MKFPRQTLFNVAIITFLVFSFVLQPSSVAYAATITVTNTNDSGAGSLRQALADAAEGDTIVIDPSLDGMTLTLTSGELEITKGLTITNGFFKIDANNNSRVFKVTATTNVELVGLLIMNGDVSAPAVDGGGDKGGALLNSNGANITIRNCEFTGNSAGTGGAIYNDGNGGNITIINSHIHANSAVFDGGAIFNSSNSGGGGTITIIGSDVNTNTADDGGVEGFLGIISYNSDGGAIFNSGASSTVNIEHSTVHSNNATGSLFNGGGGGIYNGTNATLNINYSAITVNSADNGNGGGINNQGSGKLNIKMSLVNGNYAKTNGGGVFNLGNGSNVSVLNSTIFENTALARGGGFYNKTSGLINLSNVTLTANSAVTSGVGIQNQNSATVKVRNSIINDTCTNTATLTSFGYNIESDTTCGFAGTGDQQSVASGTLNLASITDNGGYTDTIGLNAGSAAIDGGNPSGCVDENGVAVIGDQRAYERPSNVSGDTTCDIGAFEYNSQGPLLTVTSDTIDALYQTSPTQFTVTFDEDLYAPDSTDRKSVTSPENWMLVEFGSNASLDTVDCFNGIGGDDIAMEISSVTYDNGSYTATINYDAGLDTGTYALFACATTSIYESTGQWMLNAGEEENPIEFEVSVSVVTPPSPAPGSNDKTNDDNSLPNTGFAQGQVTVLPEQNKGKEYSSTTMSLSIPSLNLRTEIVGVPKTSEGWDVTWLGSQLGWLEGSAYPTWEGNTVLTGHVWDAFNQPGILADLKTLRNGDRIELYANGQTYIYEVRESVLRWSSENFSTVIKHKNSDWLTLITCEGYMPVGESYLFRRVVGAELVAIQ